MKNLFQKRYLNAVLASCLLSLASAPAALAHHSFAVHFVADRLETVEHATVKEFRFTNPHGVLLYTVTAADGTVMKGRAETNSPSVLRRRGWAKNSMKPGDRITLTGFPARDQENYMRISVIEFEDGRPPLKAQAAAD